MSQSYQKYRAAHQPDRTACWSTTMAWWTRAVVGVPNSREVDILGKYNHLTGSDGGILFPSGFQTMLEDSTWGLTVVSSTHCMMGGARIITKGDTKGPLVCGYWDSTVGGYHAVALYGYKGDSTWFLDSTIWAMDPNLGMHIKRPLSYYMSTSSPKGIVAYLEYTKK